MRETLTEITEDQSGADDRPKGRKKGEKKRRSRTLPDYSAAKDNARFLRELGIQGLRKYQQLVNEVKAARPGNRGECRDGIRPCPFVSCKYHLFLDVNPKNGHIKFNFPDVEVWELEETCVLDVAEKDGGITLEEIGRFMNLTRERVRQVEVAGLAHIEKGAGSAYREILEDLDAEDEDSTG